MSRRAGEITSIGRGRGASRRKAGKKKKLQRDCRGGPSPFRLRGGEKKIEFMWQMSFRREEPTDLDKREKEARGDLQTRD